MLVDGSSPTYLDSALRGVASACRRDERLLVFVNTERARGHLVWKMARRLGLSDRLSLIPDAEARREASMNLDGLIIAEPGGVLRSMALDAMACGMPVIAAADPALGTYIAGVTAKLISRPDPAAWEEAVAGLASGTQEFAHLRAGASNWVAANRSASAHVSAVLRTYDAVIAAREQRTEGAALALARAGGR
jgi:glycosyltransferase involved in cell wall biosynthesis